MSATNGNFAEYTEHEMDLLLERCMDAKVDQNGSKCATQNESAKSQLVAKIARLVRKEGLTYDDWRYVRYEPVVCDGHADYSCDRR
jgi:hypothetical protein